jgi:uncharacterized protein YjbI with pentapeptide repeats
MTHGWKIRAIPMDADVLLSQYAEGVRDFSAAQLHGIALFNQKLSFVNLSYADLSDADLRSLDFFGSNLSWANLTGANLAGANLARVNLRGAKLYGADLRRATLRDAILLGSFYDARTQFPEGYRANPHG